jgi:hypothetical protein
MMKKFLILMLVLGLASVASAQLVGLDISVNGNHEPVDSMIVLLPSETLTLDIHVNADITPGSAGEGNWLLICETAAGIISGGVKVPYGDVTLMGPDSASGAGVAGMPDGYDGVYGAILLVGTTTLVPASTILFDGILFHCEGPLTSPRDVVVSLSRLTDEGEYTGEIYDTVTIHQIPEPMTIMLLGLGGLLLRRRK